MKCRSLSKAVIDLQTQDDLKSPQVSSIIPEAIILRESEIFEALLSPETTDVVQFSAGYVAKKSLVGQNAMNANV